MTNGYLHVVPLLLFILIPVTFMITYTISVQCGHVLSGFPYISETGAFSPESSIFAQCLNIAALLLGFCVYIRHRQVEEWRVERGQKLVERPTIVLTTCCGALSCFGLDVLANFQQVGVNVTHMTGAMVCFTAGTIYFCLQTYLSAKMINTVNGIIIVYIRGVLSLLAITLTMVTIIPGYVATQQFRGKEYKKWRREDGGWEMRTTSVAAEWTLAIVYCVFLLTFVPEFRLIHWESPKISLIYLDRARMDFKLTETEEPTVREV